MAVHTAAPLSAVSHSAAAWPELAGVWAMLAAASPYSSVFTSAEWTGAWIAVFSSVLPISIVVFEDAAQPVGICLLTRRTVKRGPVPVKRVYLNTAGEDEEDEACIEFNNLVCLAGYELPVARAFKAHLDEEAWDELVLTAVTPGPVLEAMQEVFGAESYKAEMSAAAHVDLASLRTEGTPYERALGSRTRKNLRQNLRRYAAYGDVRLEQAQSAAEASAMLDQLADLHQTSWIARGKSGVFSSTRFFAFHRLLIETALDKTLVQLLRVSAGDHTIGLLYNFVWRGKVYFYQSGFHYDAGGQLNPGLVTIAYAVEHCLQNGYDDFDFLAGESQYKKVLSTGSNALYWAVIRNTGLKMHAVELLSQSRRWLRTLTRT
jgi:CelD/BcsL family acetyltransferase involved in cellulose biosynthesis